MATWKHKITYVALSIFLLDSTELDNPQTPNLLCHTINPILNQQKKSLLEAKSNNNKKSTLGNCINFSS